MNGGAKRPWAYLGLDCDLKTVLSLHVNESMVNGSETVMVNDGANCTLEVWNVQSHIDSAEDDPIWIMRHTIWHGDGKEDQIQILNQTSNQREVVNFEMNTL